MENETNCIRILVVDNHPLVRRALSDLLACYADMQVIGTAEDGRGAIDAANNLSPDVILLDVGLPGLSGIEVARQLRRVLPLLRIIMLTSYDTQYVEQVTGGCADAYLSKDGIQECIGEAIREVCREAPR